MAIPAAAVTACCSAMPTSTNRSGNRASNGSRPVGPGIAAVMATIRGIGLGVDQQGPGEGVGVGGDRHVRGDVGATNRQRGVLQYRPGGSSSHGRRVRRVRRWAGNWGGLDLDVVEALDVVLLGRRVARGPSG